MKHANVVATIPVSKHLSIQPSTIRHLLSECSTGISSARLLSTPQEMDQRLTRWGVVDVDCGGYWTSFRELL